MTDWGPPDHGRRRLLCLLAYGIPAAATGAQPATRPAETDPYARVVPGYRLAYPRDDGSHPAFRIEWWYVTGWLDRPAPAMGFQITFFRVRQAMQDDNPSAFAPRQIIIAHAALSDAAVGHLVHEQRIARTAFDLAGAEQGRAHVWVDDWVLRQDGGHFIAHVNAPGFTFDFRLEPDAPPLEQGVAGWSRKGPDPAAASYYYSRPGMRTRGTLYRSGHRAEVSGTAWFDHEWSSQYLDPDAAGWDWIGINLSDGGAVMAFRIRRRNGGALWAAATLRQADGRRVDVNGGEVSFSPVRTWRSPRTGISYPVAWSVRVGSRTYRLDPLFDDQEHDTRATTGAIYWEGAVTLQGNDGTTGRGYLELTGYGKPLVL